MAIINPQKKWIYLMEPHTGSRATGIMLQEQCQGSNLGHHHIGIAELTDFRRTRSVPRNLQNYNIICTVRNPFDVLITKWLQSGFSHNPDSEVLIARSRGNESVYSKNKRASNYKPFLSWVMENIDTPHDQVMIPLKGLWQECNTFVYYEHLHEDLNTVFGRKLSLPFDRKHVTLDKQPWERYWRVPEAAEVISLLSVIYDEFMSFFGYKLFWKKSELMFEGFEGFDLGETLDITINPDIRKKRCQRVYLP